MISAYLVQIRRDTEQSGWGCNSFSYTRLISTGFDLTKLEVKGDGWFPLYGGYSGQIERWLVHSEINRQRCHDDIVSDDLSKFLPCETPYIPDNDPYNPYAWIPSGTSWMFQETAEPLFGQDTIPLPYIPYSGSEDSNIYAKAQDYLKEPSLKDLYEAEDCVKELCYNDLWPRYLEEPSGGLTKPCSEWKNPSPVQFLFPEIFGVDHYDGVSEYIRMYGFGSDTDRKQEQLLTRLAEKHGLKVESFYLRNLWSELFREIRHPHLPLHTDDVTSPEFRNALREEMRELDRLGMLTGMLMFTVPEYHPCDYTFDLPGSVILGDRIWYRPEVEIFGSKLESPFGLEDVPMLRQTNPLTFKFDSASDPSPYSGNMFMGSEESGESEEISVFDADELEWLDLDEEIPPEPPRDLHWYPSTSPPLHDTFFPFFPHQPSLEELRAQTADWERQKFEGLSKTILLDDGPVPRRVPDNFWEALETHPNQALQDKLLKRLAAKHGVFAEPGEYRTLWNHLLTEMKLYSGMEEFKSRNTSKLEKFQNELRKEMRGMKETNYPVYMPAESEEGSWIGTEVETLMIKHRDSDYEFRFHSKKPPIRQWLFHIQDNNTGLARECFFLYIQEVPFYSEIHSLGMDGIDYLVAFGIDGVGFFQGLPIWGKATLFQELPVWGNLCIGPPDRTLRFTTSRARSPEWLSETFYSDVPLSHYSVGYPWESRWELFHNSVGFIGWRDAERIPIHSEELWSLKKPIREYEFVFLDLPGGNTELGSSNTIPLRTYGMCVWSEDLYFVEETPLKSDLQIRFQAPGEECTSWKYRKISKEECEPSEVEWGGENSYMVYFSSEAELISFFRNPPSVWGTKNYCTPDSQILECTVLVLLVLAICSHFVTEAI